MEKSFSLRKLSKEFYRDYPKKQYPEILRKDNRPFIVLLIQIENNRFAIPFRTNIPHNSGYRFKTSDRETQRGTGLDFSKTVIVNHDKYLGEFTMVNTKEYTELDNEIYRITEDFKKYIHNYKIYAKKQNDIHGDRFYRFSTLRYFHKELGIE